MDNFLFEMEENLTVLKDAIGHYSDLGSHFQKAKMQLSEFHDMYKEILESGMMATHPIMGRNFDWNSTEEDNVREMVNEHFYENFAFFDIAAYPGDFLRHFAIVVESTISIRWSEGAVRIEILNEDEALRSEILEKLNDNLETADEWTIIGDNLESRSQEEDEEEMVGGL